MFLGSGLLNRGDPNSTTTASFYLKLYLGLVQYPPQTCLNRPSDQYSIVSKGYGSVSISRIYFVGKEKKIHVFAGSSTCDMPVDMFIAIVHFSLYLYLFVTPPF